MTTKLEPDVRTSDHSLSGAPDVATEPHRPIEIEEAGIIYAHAKRIVATLSAVVPRSDASMIPSAVATWGDARLLFPSLLALLSHLYPELKDEATLAAILRAYLDTSAADGRPN